MVRYVYFSVEILIVFIVCDKKTYVPGAGCGGPPVVVVASREPLLDYSIGGDREEKSSGRLKFIGLKTFEDKFS